MLDWLWIAIGYALGLGFNFYVSTEGRFVAPPAILEPSAVPEVSAPLLALPSNFEAEDQTPTGKFTTAAEVKPILEATKANWVAVRDFNGQDLVYVTHLLSWRCGLHEMRVAINGGPKEVWEIPPCQVDTGSPNAIPEDALIYKSFPPGFVQRIAVELLYDDMDTQLVSFLRDEVLIP